MERGSLLVFPPEVLDTITSYLHAAHVVRLFITGTKLLQHRLCNLGGVKTFAIVDDIHFLCPKFPTIVGLFRTLESFIMESNDPACGCGMSIEGVDITLLPPTLKTLWISMSNFRLAYRLKLKERFPLLEYLAMPSRTLWHAMPDDWDPFEQLPTHLTRVHVPYYMKFEDFGRLPRFVKRLGVGINPEEMAVPEGMASLLPPRLEKLSIANLPNFDLFRHLPQTLTKLKVSSSDYHSTRNYPSVEHLIQSFSGLPPSLKFLHISFDNDTQQEGPIHAGVVAALPRSLKELHISSSHEYLDLEACQALPRSLELFTVDGIGKHSQDPVSFLQALPRTLTELPVGFSTYLDDPAAVQALPPALKILQFSPTALVPFDLGHLPSSLTDLTFTESTMSSPGSRFPPNLKYLETSRFCSDTWLNLQASQLQHLKRAKILDDDPANIQYLPSSLKRLELRVKANELESTMPYWPQFHVLKYLTTASPILEDEKHIFSNDLIMAFPRSLTSIDLTGDFVPEQMKLFLDFPLLQFLELNFMGPGLSDENFRGYDKLISLRVISIIGSSCRISAEIPKFMPPFLHSFQVPYSDLPTDTANWPASMHQFTASQRYSKRMN